MQAEYDVIIVGAGAAGLAAGARLASSGERVAIIEARDRVGGRIFTRRLAGARAGASTPIELGAEFIHGLPSVTWSLLKEAGLSAYELDGSALTFANGAWPATTGSAAHRVLADMMRWLEARPGCDMSFADYLAARPVDAESAAAAGRFVEGFNAADSRRIGIASLAAQQRAEDEIHADRVFRIGEGYDALAGHLVSRFRGAGGELVLASPARRIGWRRGAVTVQLEPARGAPRELCAKRALITVPLGVLQAESIEFEPRPADVLAQAHRLAMGEAMRIVLVFRNRFWRDRRNLSLPPHVRRELCDLSFLFTPGELPPTWWTPSPLPAPVLTAWMGGPKAAAFRGSAAAGGDGGRALPGRCLSTLAKVFALPAAELESLLSSWHWHDWSADEYTRGAYSYVPAGALDAPERLARPLENTLFFAGEHTDTSGHWGTVHAALASGVRAAGQILSAPD
ncbi:MAG TPA: NAD(P)/FAD-dependent oxidoreductase [Steroidobacteraceae bacterium]|nr:NAD(P)/FAD-dependent oxidoreductase [Steroidobacteraceae bacterium]